MGTRFLPISRYVAKEMLPVLKKPIIQYSIEEAMAIGVETVVVVVSAGKKSIMDYFGERFDLRVAIRSQREDSVVDEVTQLANVAQKVDLRYVRQEAPEGLGHAVLMTEPIIGDEPFLLFLPDDLFEQGDFVVRELVRLHDSLGGCVVAVKKVSDEEVSRYGVIEPRHMYDRTYQVLSFIEKPLREESPSNLAIMGRYVLLPSIFGALRNVPPGKNGEVQLTDGLQMLLHKESVYAYSVQGERHDCGTVSGLIETNLAFALRDPAIGPGMRIALRRLREHDGV